jgi:hypothetical protein
LQPVNIHPAPRIAKTAKTKIFTAFFTFPPSTAQNGSNWLDSPFFTYFLLLSMELQVTLRTTPASKFWKTLILSRKEES